MQIEKTLKVTKPCPTCGQPMAFVSQVVAVGKVVVDYKCLTCVTVDPKRMEQDHFGIKS